MHGEIEKLVNRSGVTQRKKMPEEFEQLPCLEAAVGHRRKRVAVFNMRQAWETLSLSPFLYGFVNDHVQCIQRRKTNYVMRILYDMKSK